MINKSKLKLFLLQPPIQVFGIEGRYAHAMYSAASKQNSLEKVEGELSKVDELIRTNEKLSEYLANPTLDKFKKQCEYIEAIYMPSVT